MYPRELTEPMRQELINAGFEDLTTIEQVDEAINNEGTTMVVVNSVCGCAAGSMRPGVIGSLQSDKKPDRLVTVFAGVEKDATERARKYMLPYPPSSPSIAVFKDGRLKHMIERHHIEGKTPDMIASNLMLAFEEYC